MVITLKRRGISTLTVYVNKHATACVPKISAETWRGRRLFPRVVSWEFVLVFLCLFLHVEVYLKRLVKGTLHLVLSFPFVWLSNFVCYVGLFKSFYGDIHLFLLILVIYFSIHTFNSSNFQFIDLLVIIIMANLNILPTPHNNLSICLSTPKPIYPSYFHHI